jgi:hypothetical protein
MARTGWLALAATAIVAPLALLGVLGSADWIAGGQPLFDSALTIPPGGEVRQAVEVPEAGLARVDVPLLRYGPVSGTIALSVAVDSDGRNVVASAETSASEAEDYANPVRRPLTYPAFRFPALDVAGGMWLRLQSHADRPMAVRVLLGGPDGEGALLNGASTNGRLTVRLHYERSIAANLAILAGRLTRGRPGVIGLPAVYIILMAAYAALVALILQLIH